MGKGDPAPILDLDNASVRGTTTQWHGQEQYADELKKQGYEKVYAKPSKPNPTPGPPDPKVLEKYAKKHKGPGPVRIPEKEIPKILPRGTTGLDADDFGKEVKKIFPTGGPDVVAIDHKNKKILVGDVTARGSSTANMAEAGRARRLPNDLQDEDFTVHHLEKTKRDAQRLSDNLSNKFKDYDIHFEDRYLEDPKRKKSKRFKLFRRRVPTPVTGAVGKGIAGGTPTDDDRGTKKKDPLKESAKKADAKANAAAKKKANPPAKKKAAVPKKAAFDAKAKAAEAAKKKAAQEAKKKAADEAKKKIAEEAKKKAAEEAKQQVAEQAKKKAAQEAKKKAADEAKKKVADEAKKKAADEAKQKAVEQAKNKAADEAKKKAVKEAEEKAAKKAVEEAEKKAAADVVAKTAGKSPKLRLKISPKIKAGAFILLEIAFEFFLGWLESNRIEDMIKAEIQKNDGKLQKVLDANQPQEDFVKFRTGEKLEKGYQLYLYLRMYITRYCSDGGCGTSGRIYDIFFMDVTFSRTKGQEFFPDPKEEKGWGKQWEDRSGGAIATFNIPLFEKGDNVEPGTEDAADNNHGYFIHRFIDRTADKGTGDNTREYFDGFRKYALMFPDSQANRVYNLKFGLNETLVDLAMVELARKPAKVLLYPPANMQFHDIIEKVKWGLAGKVLFIVDFYYIVTESGWNDDTQIYYLEKYDKYFRLMDDGFTKCNASCHRMIADRRIIHRKTADEIRAKKDSPYQKMLRGEPLDTYLDRGLGKK